MYYLCFMWYSMNKYNSTACVKLCKYIDEYSNKVCLKGQKHNIKSGRSHSGAAGGDMSHCSATKSDVVFPRRQRFKNVVDGADFSFRCISRLLSHELHQCTKSGCETQ